MKKIQYYPLKLITKNVVLIDGISRTGKLLLGSLICSFNKMEHLEFGEIFEHLLPAVKFQKVDKKFAKAFIHNYLNQLIYNKYISRNVNFRPNDRTGIMQSRNPKIYIDRLKNNDGDKVVKLIKSKKPFIPIVTHDLSVNFDILKKLNLNFKIVEILRSPIEMVYSWYKRGLVKRYGNDQRIFTLLINKKNIICPWYNALVKQEIKKQNECDKCITLVSILIRESIPKIKQMKNIYLTSYNLITQDTKNELFKISKFLRVKTNNKTKKFIRRENCPVIFDKKKFENKLNFIKKKCSKRKLKELLILQRQYEKNFYNLKQKF